MPKTEPSGGPDCDAGRPLLPNTDVFTWHLRVAYDGSAYKGWQVQPDMPTVQAELRKRLRLLFRQPDLDIFGASRTDSGVHALDQHVSFRAPTPTQITAEKLKLSLNRWLPPDIRVVDICTEDNFHARYSAVAKSYVYCIYAGSNPNPFETRYCWEVRREIDVPAMEAAASLLRGEHDFRSFAANPRRPIDSHVRHLHRLDVIKHAHRIYVHVVGNSFLYKMVRAITGFLVHAGITPGWRDEHGLRVLAARDRRAAPQTAPAIGLFLAQVFYEERDWHSYVPRVPPTQWHWQSK